LLIGEIAQKIFIYDKAYTRLTIEQEIINYVRCLEKRLGDSTNKANSRGGTV